MHRLIPVLRVELSGYLDLDTIYRWNHNEHPVEDADGNVARRENFPP